MSAATVTDVGTAVPTRFTPWLTTLALVLGPALMATSNALWALMDPGGGGDATTAGDLALAGAHPTLYLASSVAAALACVLLVPAVWEAARLASRRSPRWAAAGGWLTATGYVLYFGFAFQGFLTLEVATRGSGLDAYAVAADGALAHPSLLWFTVLLIGGNLLGPVLLGVVLLRSRAVPRWAAVAVLAWAPVHLVGRIGLGTEWLSVVGMLLLLAGFAAVARAVAREG